MDTLIKFDNLAKVLEEMAVRIRDEYKSNLNQSDRNASLNLSNSVEYYTSFNGQDYVIGLQLENYWKYIEYGTKPHFPPISAIMEWIDIKPLKDGSLPSPRQLAFLIGRKISKVGTEGKNDMEKAVSTIAEEFDEKVLEAIDKDVNGNIEGIVRVLYTH